MAFAKVQLPLPPTATCTSPSVVRAAATDDPGTRPDRLYIILSIALIVLGVIVGTWIKVKYNVKPFTPAPGISMFALFYLVAQSLERISEILALLWPGAGATTVNGATVTKTQALVQRNQELAAVFANLGAPAADLALPLAKKQRTVNVIRANRAVLFWSINSLLASAAAGYFGLFFLQVVGAKNAPTFLDIAVTGLALGGGSKPLHDLITNIQKTKENKEDPPETR